MKNFKPPRASDAGTPRKPLVALSAIGAAVLVTALFLAWNTAQAAPGDNVLTPSKAVKPRFAVAFPTPTPTPASCDGPTLPN